MSIEAHNIIKLIGDIHKAIKYKKLTRQRMVAEDQSQTTKKNKNLG